MTAEPAPQAQEPCAMCGRETAIGSLLHRTRRTIAALDARDLFVCADCEEVARASRGGVEPLSDDELLGFITTASLAGIAWSNG
jgi:hypothetical protein